MSIKGFVENIDKTTIVVGFVLSIIAATIATVNYFAKQTEVDSLRENLMISVEKINTNFSNLDEVQRVNTVKVIQFYLASEIISLRELKKKQPNMFGDDKGVRLEQLEQSAAMMGLEEPFIKYLSIMNFMPVKADTKISTEVNLPLTERKLGVGL